MRVRERKQRHKQEIEKYTESELVRQVLFITEQ